MVATSDHPAQDVAPLLLLLRLILADLLQHLHHVPNNRVVVLCLIHTVWALQTAVVPAHECQEPPEHGARVAALVLGLTGHLHCVVLHDALAYVL